MDIFRLSSVKLTCTEALAFLLRIIFWWKSFIPYPHAVAYASHYTEVCLLCDVALEEKVILRVLQFLDILMCWERPQCSLTVLLCCNIESADSSNRAAVMRAGMNLFLKNLDITFRRDPTNYRPRINKMHSVKDQEQKSAGSYYYLDD